MFSVYIIRCNDGSLYTGITSNIRKRILEHAKGTVPFTKNRGPVTVVYSEEFTTRSKAALREKEIKGWRREKKGKLIILH